MKQLAFFLLIFANTASVADWSLNNKASSFNYFSFVKDDLTVNSFSNMSGSISDQGALILRVDLNSIDTNNTHRNIYLQDNFLETWNFQEGELAINFGEQLLNRLEDLKAHQIQLQGFFSLHGTDQKLDLTLLITRLEDNFLIIKTYQPVILKLADFGYDDGIAKLQKRSPFKNITGTVPIALNLFFTWNKPLDSLLRIPH